ncbi:autotransporter secretion outer membrane protein TamA [Aliiroseovarius halocynthiae]|uniref:autotransporter assembly complex protein TamA n=1 Tax=Aliiroseovarius halocynthiae TaxID=985055 RepID=UPI001FE71A91|nr:autotransporter assembly complex family protein [Aliiroseovarius halocynthiae]SMR71737.1 autotransporter secretion outer membrane protein TamA [Aliiroseovarius halocynthiae]
MKKLSVAPVWRHVCVPAALAVFGQAALALDEVEITVLGADSDLESAINAASLVQTAKADDETDPRDVMAAALAEYGRLTEVLYANGYYGGVVRVLVDGREAGRIPVFHLPARINKIAVTVDPGHPFTFGTARVAPLAQGTVLPKGFRSGERAESTQIQAAADAAHLSWRQAGHPKATLTGQRVTADHTRKTLSADLRFSPGPKARFGTMTQTSDSTIRSDRIARIAGFPTGTVYSPEALDKVANRLRRTGAFSSVALTEAEVLNPDNTLDVDLALADEKPRRFGFGAELSSLEGIGLSGFWMHRNFLGGAERFRVEGEVTGIGGQSGGIDYRLGARLEQPATFGPDTTAFGFVNAAYEDEPAYISRNVNLGVGMTRIFSDTLTGEIGVGVHYSDTTDVFGNREFFHLTLPVGLTWDRRNDMLDATDGTYVRAEITPFLSLNDGGSGARGFVDARAYRGLGAGDRFVLAGRVHAGTVYSDSVQDIPPEYLFFSGGGNSVRGQPYQSLGIPVGTDGLRGGRSYLAVSTELRATITDTIGVVAFADAGHISDDSLFAGNGDWHAGAGLGLRYKTPIGPLRLDVAGPVSGDTGDGVQIYLGIGQAF